MAHSRPSLDAHSDTSPAGTAHSAAAPSTRGSRRLLLFLLPAALICFVGVAAFLRLFVAQRIPELTAAELERAEELWDRVGAASYEMDLEILRGRPGKVHIEVQNEEITTMTRDGVTPKQHTWWYSSVPGLFETLERELEMAEDPVHEVGAAAGTRWQLRCEFDAAYGYPRKFHRYVYGGGQEVFWRVTSFVPK